MQKKKLSAVFESLDDAAGSARSCSALLWRYGWGRVAQLGRHDKPASSYWGQPAPAQKWARSILALYCSFYSVINFRFPLASTCLLAYVLRSQLLPISPVLAGKASG